ncbi:MAG: 30S ribosomal protein S2 [Candidatus Micrarchaeota archaeon]
MASGEFLIPQEKYLESGAHIGTRTKNGSMRDYIYKARDDGLHVINLRKLDEKLRAASELLSKYEPSKVYLVGSKDNAKAPIAKAAELTGFQGLSGRFTPGTFTNPLRDDFKEPDVVFIVDPGVDKQAVREAADLNIPIIALCDTNNSTRCIDLVVPTNNKGRKSIALMFWVLSREILKKQGKISGDDEFKIESIEFEA